MLSWPAALILIFAAGALVGFIIAYLMYRKKALPLTVLDRLPLAIWRRSTKLDLTWANKAALGLFGQDVQKKEFDQTARQLAKKAQKNKRLASESRTLVVEGSARILDVAEIPLPNGTLVGYGADQTALEAVQAELVLHVSAHREMLQSLHTGIFIFGRDKRLNFFNKAGADLFNLSPASLENAPTIEQWLDILRDHRRLPEYADFRSFARDFTRRMMNLIGPSQELIHNPQDQTFRMTANPHPLGGTILTFEDVTDLLTLESNYNTLIAVQEETIDQLIEAVAVFGGDGRLKLFNPSFVRMWGIDRRFLSGEPHGGNLVKELHKSLVGQKDIANYVIDDISSRETKQWRLELNEHRVIDVMAVPLSDGGRLFQYSDVTDTLLRERALEDRNAALMEADRVKSEFMANVSYEFRTPLNAIVGYTELLSREYFGALNQKQREYTDAILASAQELVELIGNVLDVTAIEAGHITLEAKPIELGLVLSESINLAKPRYLNRNFHFNVPKLEHIATVNGDAARLKQAFGSLFNLAFSGMPNSGVLDLQINYQQGYVNVILNQQGGMALNRDQGRQLQSGLSLVLVKTLLELHGGQLWSEREGDFWKVICRLPYLSSGQTALPTPSKI